MKAFNFEIYTNNPETGESGWDIVFRTVLVDSTETNSKTSGAREVLKQTPLFDCVILFNYYIDVDMASLSSEQLTAIETGYTDNPDLF